MILVLTPPYIKNMCGLPVILLHLQEMVGEHRSSKSLQTLVSKLKEQLKIGEGKFDACKVKHLNTNKRYIGRTGRRLSTRMYEYKLAKSRPNPLSLSHIPPPGK